MASRLLADLTPPTAALASQWLAACRESGLDVLVYCTLRPATEQARLYWQGRDRSQVERKAARMRRDGYPRLADLLLGAGSDLAIRDATAGGIVTQAGPGESAHQFGLAWDAVPMQAGKPLWAATAKEWATLGAIAARLGIEWGGNWQFRDQPHFQVLAGRSLRFFALELDEHLGESAREASA